MSILKVARMGHPVLRTKARPVDRAVISTPEFQKLVDDMIETMEEYHGIGLAAPQVHESVRLFIAGIEEESDEGDIQITPIPLVNPELTAAGRETVEDWEGCLSIPDVRGLVPRFKRVNVRALDRHGDRIELQLEGFPSRVVQHENDHLDGVLFLDRMKSFDSLTFLEEYSRYWAKAQAD
jgi:peptide deformylase